MSTDTKKALVIIKPMAKELNIDVSADDNYLYCDDQAIGIGWNSTRAVIMKFIRYVIDKEGAGMSEHKFGIGDKVRVKSDILFNSIFKVVDIDRDYGIKVKGFTGDYFWHDIDELESVSVRRAEYE